MKRETTELIINALQFLIAFGISAFALVAGVKEYFKQRSLGAAKVIELMEADKRLQSDIEKLKSENVEQTDLINQLKSDYRLMMTKILDLLK